MREQGLNFIETQCNARLTAKKYLDTFTSLV
jgi:hypothetical protein